MNYFFNNNVHVVIIIVHSKSILSLLTFFTLKLMNFFVQSITYRKYNFSLDMINIFLTYFIFMGRMLENNHITILYDM